MRFEAARLLVDVREPNDRVKVLRIDDKLPHEVAICCIELQQSFRKLRTCTA